MTKRPASLIVQRLGQANAERLSSIAGGVRLHVPGKLTNADRLRTLLGEDLAVLVVLHFGDSRINIPRMKRSTPVDIRAVVRFTKRGWSAPRIAKELGCCDRTVHALRSTARAKGLLPQLIS